MNATDEEAEPSPLWGAATALAVITTVAFGHWQVGRAAGTSHVPTDGALEINANHLEAQTGSSVKLTVCARDHVGQALGSAGHPVVIELRSSTHGEFAAVETSEENEEEPYRDQKLERSGAPLTEIRLQGTKCRIAWFRQQQPGRAEIIASSGVHERTLTLTITKSDGKESAKEPSAAPDPTPSAESPQASDGG
jgi:hypothetical protein